MPNSFLSLAEKVKLLFEIITNSDGKRYTYEQVRHLGNVDPSTVSRIRSGHNKEPTFNNIAGLVKAFDVSADYFFADMTTEEAREYLSSERDNAYLTQLKLQAKAQDADKMMSMAQRASQLDPEMLEMVENMIKLGLKQKGVDLAEEPGASDVDSD